MISVYIAGPYTQGDVGENMHRALSAWHWVWKAGAYPFLPHLTHYVHIHSPGLYEDWMDYDMYWLEKCDALYRMPGESPGAEREVARARELDKPVFFSLPDLKEWLLREGIPGTESPERDPHPQNS